MSGQLLAEFSRELPSIISGWNWVINPDFSRNVRGAASKAQSPGVYGYDRWKGATVAGSLVQVIEALPAGEYTLRYTTPSESYEEGFSHSGGNREVEVPDTALWVEVTDKSVGAAEVRPQQVEIELCSRYAQSVALSAQFYAVVAGQTLDIPVLWSELRDVPAVTVTDAGTLTNMTSATLTPETSATGYLRLVADGASASAVVSQKRFLLTAEL